MGAHDATGSTASADDIQDLPVNSDNAAAAGRFCDLADGDAVGADPALMSPPAEGDYPSSDGELHSFFEDADDFAAPAASARSARLTRLLTLLLVVVVSFAAGSYAQNRYGPAGGTGATRGGALPSGMPMGPAATAAAGSTTPVSSSPAVIGTVVAVSGDQLTVRDFAGKTHVIAVGSGTKVVSETRIELPALKSGDAVSVAGSTSEDGVIAATSVTKR